MSARASVQLLLYSMMMRSHVKISIDDKPSKQLANAVLCKVPPTVYKLLYNIYTTIIQYYTRKTQGEYTQHMYMLYIQTQAS